MYISTRDEFGKSVIVSDPVRGPIITRLFEEYATGAYTIAEMTAKAREWGLRSKSGFFLQKSVMHRLFQHPFYYGEMEIKGEMYAHRHEALIPRWLYQACQEVRLGHHKKPFKYADKEFIFRGLLTCTTSGHVVTADTKNKTYKNSTTATWTYLRCWNPENPEKKMWVREEEIMTQVEAVLSRLGIRDKAFLEDTILYLKETNKMKKEHHTVEVAMLKKEHTEIQAKLDKLMDLRLDGEITKEDFEMKKRRLKDRQYEVSRLVLTYDKADDEFTKRMEMLLNLTHEAPKLWKGSTITQKRELLNLVFANLELKGATLCYTLRKPFDSFLNDPENQNWRCE